MKLWRISLKDGLLHPQLLTTPLFTALPTTATGTTGSSASNQSPRKVSLSDAQSPHHEEAVVHSNRQQEVTDDWEDWESPFQSRSTSPNMENQDPNDSRKARSGILAWHSPGRKHCEAETDGLWSTARVQKHKSGVKGTRLPDSKRYTILPQG